MSLRTRHFPRLPQPTALVPALAALTTANSTWWLQNQADVKVLALSLPSKSYVALGTPRHFSNLSLSNSDNNAYQAEIWVKVNDMIHIKSSP